MRSDLISFSGVCLCAAIIFGACSAGQNPPGPPSGQKQSGPNLDTPRLEKVYRTGKALAMGFDGGVNFQKAGDLTRELSIEVAIAADHLQTPQGKDVLSHYSSAADVFKDSQTIWQKKIAGDGLDHSALDEWLLAGATEPVTAVLVKYELPVVENLPKGTFTIAKAGEGLMFYPNDVLQRLWQLGQARLGAADKSYLALEGPPQGR